MKLNLIKRALACCLIGAATIAVTSGMKKVEPPDGEAEISSNLETTSEIDFINPEEGDLVASGSSDSLDDTQKNEPRPLREMTEVEQRNEKLLEAARNAGEEDKGEKRDALKSALTEIFHKRSEAQQLRITAMRQQLDAIEAQLKRRLELEGQIVQRRLSELLGEQDELSWDHEPAVESLAERRMDKRGQMDRLMEFPMQNQIPTVQQSYNDHIILRAQQNSALDRERAEMEKQRSLLETQYPKDRSPMLHSVDQRRNAEAEVLRAKLNELRAQNSAKLNEMPHARQLEAQLEERSRKAPQKSPTRR